MEFWPGKRFSTHGLKVSLPNEDLAYNQLKSGLDSQTISHINILSGHLLSSTQAHIVQWPNTIFYGNLDIEYIWDIFLFLLNIYMLEMRSQNHSLPPYMGVGIRPRPFLRTQTFEKFYNFLNAGLSYITVFVFQAAFKYETRNDQTFTQVKLFDKNIELFFILLYLIFVVILTT